MMDLLEIVRNVAGYLPSLERLFMLVCWLMGVIFVVNGVRSAAVRNDAGRNAGTWFKPMNSVLIGVCFIAMPGVLSTITMTVFGGTTPDASRIFEYAPATVGVFESGSPGRTMVTALVMIFQFYGAIAVARGLYLLKVTSDGGQGPQTFGPAITHIIAGACATNFPLFLGTLEKMITG